MGGLLFVERSKSRDVLNKVCLTKRYLRLVPFIRVYRYRPEWGAEAAFVIGISGVFALVQFKGLGDLECRLHWLKLAEPV